ncbi:MAG: hypothetical protein DI613_20100, partial [Kocuria rhizophila]
APLMEDEKLLGQAGANSLEQFLASPNLERSAMGAVYANEDAFAKMTDIVGRGGDPSKMIVAAIGEYLYLTVRGGGVPEGAVGEVGPVDVGQSPAETAVDADASAAGNRPDAFVDETGGSEGVLVDETGGP